MDFALYEFLKKLQRSLTRLLNVMSILSDRVIAVIQYLQGGEATLKAELATVKEELAVALADDAADEADIAAAKAEAEAARQAADAATAKVAELQALADADVAEDEAITAALDSVPGAPV